MRNIPAAAIAAIVWIGSIATCWSSEPHPEQTVPAEVARWISGLSADDYHQRQRASAELIQLGTLGAPHLAQAMVNNSSAETRWRAQVILEQIALTADDESAHQAIKALERVADHADPAAPQMIATIRSRRKQCIQNATMKALVNLGAVFETHSAWQPLGAGSVTPFVLADGSLPVAPTSDGGVDILELLDPDDISPPPLSPFPASEPLLGPMKILDGRKIVLSDPPEKSESALVISDWRPPIIEVALPENNVVVFNDAWQGTAADLLLLQRTAHVSHLKFENISLSDEAFTALTQVQSIQFMTLENVRFSPEALKVFQEARPLVQVHLSDQH